MEVVVDPNGGVRLIYDEQVDLTSLGPHVIERVSCVEPDAGGLWLADLTQSGGPCLGPYSKRSQAIDAELAWLRAHWLV